jgi:hypothetical protein
MANAGTGTDTGQITGQAPPVNGGPAFWTSSSLLWWYARGGWAILSGPGPLSRPVQAELVGIADSIRYVPDTRLPALFPVQLTGVPASWAVRSVYYARDGRSLRAAEYQVATGPFRR